MPIKTVPDAENLIKDWMAQRNITSGKGVEKLPSEFRFRFSGKDRTGIPFSIVQPNEWERTILVVSEVRITEERNKSIEVMEAKDRNDLLNNLYQEMSFGPAPFAFAELYENTQMPKAIQFSKEICYDGLTEDRLNSAVRDVVSGVVYVIWRIRTNFGEPKME